jgi:acyl CoA:acetate/3-ketoacid CoA transferase
MSAHVAGALIAENRLHEVTLAIEQGMYDGIPASGDLFGLSRGASARVSSAQQFDLFSAGLLDACCLGMAQVDASGSVNVSRFGGQIIGPGGFIDISQNAPKAVFCGTFTTKGLRADVFEGNLRILQEGAIPKFVSAVEEITYSGPFAVSEQREAVYVTERAVFVLRPEGLELTEVAPGVSIERDILPQMGFRPLIRNVQPMPTHLFQSVPHDAGVEA